MKHSVLGFSTAFVFFLLTGGPLAAHHSFMGEFDLSKPITLKGTITKVEWANPHISFNVDVKGEGDKVTHWNVQSGNPGALKERGWTRNSLKPGDRITVVAYPAKNSEAFAVARSVTLSDGRKLSANSDGVQP